MRQFELTDEGAGILREILEHHLSELRMEIANTDDRDFRRYLRERIEFLEDFVEVVGREPISEEVTAPQAFTTGLKAENLDFLLE